MQELINFISHHLLLSLAAVLLFALIVVVELIRARRHTFSLSPAQATQKINHDHAVVIDLRAKEHYLNGHIIDSLSFTTEDLQLPKKIEKFKARPIILVGNTGLESQKIAAQLLKQGYNAYSLSGGLRTWTDAQMPVVKSK